MKSVLLCLISTMAKIKSLMEACKPLNEYAWLIDKIRHYQKTTKNLEASIDMAINEMADDFVIKKFLLSNKAEVKGMFLTEWDQEKVLAQERREAEYMANERVATDMLKDGEPIAKIMKYSRLAESTIRGLANTLGITV